MGMHEHPNIQDTTSPDKSPENSLKWRRGWVFSSSLFENLRCDLNIYCAENKQISAMPKKYM